MAFGGGGGRVTGMAIGGLKFTGMAGAAAYLLAGAAAAAAVVFFILHMFGLTVGYLVAGAPVMVQGYHEGATEMHKYAAAHGVSSNVGTGGVGGGATASQAPANSAAPRAAKPTHKP